MQFVLGLYWLLGNNEEKILSFFTTTIPTLPTHNKTNKNGFIYSCYMTAFFIKNKIYFFKKVLFTYKSVKFQKVNIKLNNFLENFVMSSMTQAVLGSQ